MTDPEIEYQRLLTGDAAALRTAASTLELAVRRLEDARVEIADACLTPVWTGSAANLFSARGEALRQGVEVTEMSLSRARGALETSASAYDLTADRADHLINFWRNRPTLPPVIEELFARVVNAALLRVGSDYNQQLAGVAAVLSGEDIDLDGLDEDTRTWVEKGMAKNEEWLNGNNSSLGPLIPNISATGDDRGLIPQGLGYVPGLGGRPGTLVQTYYSAGGPYAALIDEATGQEISDVKLGDSFLDADGIEQSASAPSHAGGVSVDGDNVYVADAGVVRTYSLAEIRNAGAGETVPQSAPPQEGVDGGSYSAMHDGKLYLGDFENDLLYVYEKNAAGEWVQDPSATVSTPKDCQGVLVRDGEFVFSSSYGRDNNGSLIVQDRDDETDRSVPYDLPNMSEGLVEVNGQIVVTYESGAEKYDHMPTGPFGWLWGVPDSDSLWANPFMTRTPLGDLGLGEDYEVEPATLKKGAHQLDSPSTMLTSVASRLDGVLVPPHAFGAVPKATTVSSSVTQLVEFSAESARTGAKAVALASDNLAAAADDYLGADDFIGSVFRPR